MIHRGELVKLEDVRLILEAAERWIDDVVAHGWEDNEPTLEPTRAAIERIILIIQKGGT